MIGFNFKEHKIDDLEDYNILTLPLNYETEYLEKDIESGSKFIVGVFEGLVEQIKPQEDYLIILQAVSETELDEQIDGFLLFSAFMNVFKGEHNDRGYLRAPERIRRKMGGAEFNKTKLMNMDFEYGTIQLEIHGTKGEIFEWIW